MSDIKKPAARVTIYPVSATIWRNQKTNGAYFAVTFERSYKDEAGKWQSSSSFDSNELLLLAKVADRAHSELIKLREADRIAGQSEEAL